MKPDLITFREIADSATFASEAAALVSQWIEKTLSEKNRCVLALSGGSTPRALYTLLGQNAGIDWSKVLVCLIDDRYSPATHDDSNQKMVRETLIGPAHIPEDHFLAPNTEQPLVEAVDDFEKRVLREIGNGEMDIVVLGMGDDGHVASLFPPLTDEGLTRMGIVHTTTDRFAVRDRIGMSLPLLQRTRHRLLILSGSSKKKALDASMSASEDLKRWPLQAFMDDRLTVFLSA